MSSGSFTTLTTSANCILGSSSTNAHQLNGSLTVYNNGLTLNNSNIIQTGSSQTNTIAGSTTFNNSVTLNSGITNNIITIGQLTISYGYKQGALTANYLQFDLPTSINNSLFLAQVNGVYSLYFGTVGSQIGRLFATASQMYFDFYNNFTFRYVSSLNGSSGLNLVFNINNSGISTNGSVIANIMNSAIGYALSYSTIPSSYYSNYNLIGSQQVFFANTTNIVSQSPSFTAPITNVLIITIGTGPTNLQPGIYNLQCSWIYWSSNTSNTMTFQWVSFGISSTSSTGNITVNDVLNEYKQETRTIPTNASSLQTLDFALKYSTNLTINTNDFSANVICFNAFGQYIGATGAQMIGTGQAATKFVFTRIG